MPAPTLSVLTRHAALRAGQRGVTREMIDALLTYGDVEVPVGGGCTCLRCSRAALGPEVRSVIGALADRLLGLRAIIADEDGGIVTVFHDRGRRPGRRYRRGP